MSKGRKLKREAWSNGKTACCWCGQQMYFARLETKPAAKKRLGLANKEELKLRLATLEHLIPRAHGGGDRRENLRLACMSCNSKRGAPKLSDLGEILFGAKP